MVNRNISICVPTWNRVGLTMGSFMRVYDDERVSEVIIVDDSSEWGLFMELEQLCAKLPKIKLYRNTSNQDCYKNKMTSISHSTNNWCVLLDSDNEINTGYIDKIFEKEEWNDDTIYTPSFAMPHFDFRAYEGLTVTKENISEWVDKPSFETMLNAANYFVNKNQYLRVWDGSIDPVTSDSIYQCYNWLRLGNRIEVVSGLHYEHGVDNHGDEQRGHYVSNCSRTPQGFHQSVINKLRELK